MTRMIINTSKNALMLVGGGVVGAGLALLLAPHSGRRTRRDIVRLGTTIGRKGDKLVRDLTRNVNTFTDKVGDKTAGILREGRKLTREGKKGVLTFMEKGEEALGSRRGRLARLFV